MIYHLLFVLFLSVCLAILTSEIIGGNARNDGIFLLEIVFFFWLINMAVNDWRQENPSAKELALRKKEKDQVREIKRRGIELQLERQKLKEYKEQEARKKKELEREMYLDKAQAEWNRYSSTIDFNKVDDMTGEDFELAVKIMYQNMGYQAETTPLTGDFGADVLVRIDEDQVSAIQVKRSKTNVGNKAVMEALAGMKHYDATHAIVLTNAMFTNAAKEQAKSANVELIDRDTLFDMWCVAFPSENRLGEFNLDKYEENKLRIHAALYGQDLSNLLGTIRKYYTQSGVHNR